MQQQASAIASCLECCEDCFDYLDDSAYAYICITGDSFCHGAVQGMYLRVKYLAQVAFAQTIAKAFIFIGKLAIVVANCGLF